METSLTQSQSALRLASDAYCDMLAEKGWAEADRGMLGLANTLLHGRATPAGAAYTSRIGAHTHAPAIVLGRIAADSEAARAGLEAVTSEARDVLTGTAGEGSGRGDVISYERALVRAQIAYRSFAEALDAVSVRADMDTSPVSEELTRFASAIDEARRVADRLADRYAGAGGAVS
ncbi:hypothetical protein [Hyphomonas sp.]|uniref:hypothetical protein n=1 Tax=Hyphomonas sp. TaxID=87 RepID=UPI00391DAC07